MEGAGRGGALWELSQVERPSPLLLQEASAGQVVQEKAKGLPSA